MTHAVNPSPWEAETGGSELGVQPGEQSSKQPEPQSQIRRRGGKKGTSQRFIKYTIELKLGIHILLSNSRQRAHSTNNP